MPTLSRPERARLYRSIGQLIEAGVPFSSLVDALDRSFRSLAGRVIVRRMRESAVSGNPLSEAILRSEDLGFPRLHGIVIAAAERGGDLGRPLARLAQDDELAEQRRRETLQRSAYPILLVHAAAAAPAAARLASDPIGTALALGAFLLPIDALLFVMYRAIATPRESPKLARLVRILPPFDRLAHDRSGANFLATTQLLYEAGVPLLEASRIASDTVPHEDLRRVYLEASTSTERAGSPFADLLDRLPRLRVEVVGTLTVAETAGNLGEALRSTSQYLEETATADQQRLLKRTLNSLVVIAVVYAAYQILSFWSAYYSRIANIR